MTFRERVEANPLFWLLSALVTGFLAGLGTYEGIQRIAQLQVISKAEIAELKQCCENASKTRIEPSFDVKIESPEEGSQVSSPVLIRGTVTSPVPAGKLLWIVLEDDDQDFYPFGQLSPDPNGSWEASLTFGSSWNKRNGWILIVQVDQPLISNSMKILPGNLMAKRRFYFEKGN